MASHRMLGQPKVGGQLHNAFPPTGRYGGPSAADNAARLLDEEAARRQLETTRGQGTQSVEEKDGE